MARERTGKQRPPKTEVKAPGPTAAADDIPDAEIVSQTPPAAPEPPTDAAPEPAAAPAAAQPEATQQAQPEAEAEAQPATASDPAPASVADTPSATDRMPDTAAPDAPSDLPKAEADQPAAPPKAAPPPPPAPSGPGFLPLLLGGAVAAALGYGAHMLTQAPRGADVQAELAELRATIAALPRPDPVPAFDPSDLQAQIAALQADVATLGSAPSGPDPADLARQISENAAQIAAQDAALAALRQDLAALASLSDTLDAVRADIDDLRILATERVTEAEAAVDTARARAALDILAAGLVTGAPLAPALDQIAQAGFAVPDALTAVAPGVQTLEQLALSFPAAARAAVRESLLDAPAASTTERLGNFLRAQVGAISTSPRDGDDPDAIVSRAGAAVTDGNLPAALTELAALPDPARAAMAPWLTAAQARTDAEAALAEFSATIAP